MRLLAINKIPTGIMTAPTIRSAVKFCKSENPRITLTPPPKHRSHPAPEIHLSAGCLEED